MGEVRKFWAKLVDETRRTFSKNSMENRREEKKLKYIELRREFMEIGKTC